MAISNDPLAVADQPHRGWAALSDKLWANTKRRKLASLAIALLIEALIVLLLLSLGLNIAGEPDGNEAVTEFAAVEFADPPEPEPEAQPDQTTDAAPQEVQPTPDQPQPQPLRPSPLTLKPQPSPPLPPPASPAPPPPAPAPNPAPSASPKIAARINPGRTYGPADTGNPRTANDSAQVGTAPNGEPLFAARWYREPTDSELAGYLSTANNPGSALIACKTVPDYYVEDCVLLSESPPGTQVGRAVMAAAWQFRVRPARVGGREQVGSWVRIRIDYSQRRAPR